MPVRVVHCIAYADRKDNDWAVSIVADHIGATADARFFRERSRNYQSIWNNATGFMEARRADGSWAGEDAGWCEGDHWAYSFDVMVC